MHPRTWLVTLSVLLFGCLNPAAASKMSPFRPIRDDADFFSEKAKQEANDILRRELDAQRRPKRVEAESTQVLVEVAHPRRQGKRLNARSFGAFGQCRERLVTGCIGVAGDVEPAQLWREQQGGEVVGRERGSHRHGRQRTAQRQHRLDAFTNSEDVVGRAKADGMAEETAHGPSRRIDRRLAEAVRRKPGAMRAGDGAGKIGDDGDHRRSGLS